jgi:hypothetical protein
MTTCTAIFAYENVDILKDICRAKHSAFKIR